MSPLLDFSAQPFDSGGRAVLIQGSAGIIHHLIDSELNSFNGKPKATVCLEHGAIGTAVAFGLPLNEFGPVRLMTMNHPG